jgi:ribosomal protein S18 acetylase RimI-like enzyme
MQARRGELVDVLEGGARSGAIALVADRSVGLVTWMLAPGNREAEVRSLAVEASARGTGVGRSLLAAAEGALRAAGVGRAWLVTTNDNLAALALYQKAGWRLSELRTGALDEVRRTIKPSIPEIGAHGIPLRDELKLAKTL